METTFHGLSAAPAFGTEPVRDWTRASTIAKPQKAFAVAFAVLATALAGCASGFGAGSLEDANGYNSRVAKITIVGAHPINIAYSAAPATPLGKAAF